MPGMAEGRRSAFIPSNTSDGNIRNTRTDSSRALERENLGLVARAIIAGRLETWINLRR